MVRLLGDADSQVVALAPKAVAELPDPAGCEGDSVREAMLVPDDPEQQERVESLRLRLAEAAAMRDLGRTRDALERFLALQGEAREVGFEPVLGEALIHAGQAQLDAGEIAAGKGRLEEALFIARTHGQDVTAYKALRGLAFINTSYDEEPPLARWQIREMEALVRRLGDPPLEVATTLLARARLEREQGEEEGSLRLFQEALEILVRTDVRTDTLIVAHDNLASSLEMLGRHEEAAEVLARAEALAPSVLGPAHPYFGNLLVHAARIESSRSEHVRSVELLRQALEVFEAAYGAQHPNIAAVLNGLGLELTELGRTQEALASFRQALLIQRQYFDDDHHQTLVIEQNLANTLRYFGRVEESLPLLEAVVGARADGSHPSRHRSALESLADSLRTLGRYDEAEARYEEALEVARESGEDSPFDLAYARLGLALCELGRGEHEAAARMLAEVQADYEDVDDPGPHTRTTLATTRFARAMVLRALDPESSEALELAARARALWAERPARFRQEIAQVDAWSADGVVVTPLL